jgi:hypothetical protein
MTDKTKSQVAGEYGERCSVVQAGCPVCDAWAMFDKWGICPTTEQLRDFQTEGEESMTDREKFDAWLALCPVTVRENKNFAYGYIEVHVSLPDEADE